MTWLRRAIRPNSSRLRARAWFATCRGRLEAITSRGRGGNQAPRLSRVAAPASTRGCPRVKVGNTGHRGSLRSPRVRNATRWKHPLRVNGLDAHGACRSRQRLNGPNWASFKPSEPLQRRAFTPTRRSRVTQNERARRPARPSPPRRRSYAVCIRRRCCEPKPRPAAKRRTMPIPLPIPMP